MGILSGINNFLESLLGTLEYVEEENAKPVTVWVKGVNAKEYLFAMNQYNLHINLKDSVKNSSAYVFGFNIERSIETATAITVSGLEQNSKTYRSMPAWYVKEDKKLYVGTGSHYFVVDGTTLTYT